MRRFLPTTKMLTQFYLLAFVLIFTLNVSSQEEVDNPNLDQIPRSLLEQAKTQQQQRAAQVITIDNYDNFYLGVDFAESHNSVNPEEPTQFFNAWNTDGSYYTMDGYNWSGSQPAWGANVWGDPVTAYDGQGNLYYEIMYGSSGIQGCLVARSTDNGQTWDFVETAISGFDKNWIACDQTSGPYGGYVYTTMTTSGGGNFARSTDNGQTWQNTWVAPTQSLPGMMVCVGPDGDTDGGSVYVVTNGGNTFAATYTFYESNDGGATFSLKSAQNFAGYVGTNVNGRHSVNNMRTRPYPFITADNSDGPYRGRLHLVYAKNDPPGNGNNPDIWARYSDDGGATWSSAKRVNSGLFPSASSQFEPATWCDLETGRLYVHWMDSRVSEDNSEAAIYGTYSDDGGQTFKPSTRISNENMVINCSTCGGGGTPRYQGDYNGIVSNSITSQPVWADFRYGSFASFTAYFPDFAMTIFPEVKEIAYRDTVWAVVPDVKLYEEEAIFTASLPNPSSGTFTISYPEGQSISSFPDSVPIVITADGVPLGNYSLTVRGEGPNETPVHYRESTIAVVALPPPVAEFRATPTELCIDGVVDFVDETLNGPTSWSWTFEGGTPETSTEQNPSGIVYESEGTFNVTLAVTNPTGSDTLVKTGYITVGTQPEPPTGVSKAVCVLDSIPSLEVDGTMVLWYKNPELDTIIFEGNVFNTGETEVGIYLYYVTQSNGFCDSEPAQISLTINPLPEVTLQPMDTICENAAPVELTGGMPEGGMYFGPGVDGGFFNPSVVGAGTFNLGYAYADENSCADTAYQEIVVQLAPVVTLSPLGGGCITNAPFELTGGSPEGGTYSGDGVEDNMFYPEMAGTGEHIITYSYTNENGCTESAFETYTVYPLPQVDIGNDTIVCANKTVVLNAETPDGEVYEWMPGNIHTPSITVDSTGIGIGSQEFTVMVTSFNGCTNSASVTVEFTDCTGIDEIAGLEGFTIFPNPNDGNFTLNLLSTRPLSVDVKLYSSAGELIYAKEAVSVNKSISENIVIDNAGAGIYLLMLESDGGQVYKKVLVK